MLQIGCRVSARAAILGCTLLVGELLPRRSYPEPLCDAIVHGIAEQTKFDGISRIDRLNMSCGQLRSWPANWVDPVHEEPGGCDKYGLKLRNGI